MSDLIDRFKARREQLLSGDAAAQKMDRPDVPARLALEFRQFLDDWKESRQVAVAGGVPKRAESVTEKQPKQEPVRLRTPASAGEGFEEAIAELEKAAEAQRSKMSKTKPVPSDKPRQ